MKFPLLLFVVSFIGFLTRYNLRLFAFNVVPQVEKLNEWHAPPILRLTMNGTVVPQGCDNFLSEYEFNRLGHQYSSLVVYLDCSFKNKNYLLYNFKFQDEFYTDTVEDDQKCRGLFCFIFINDWKRIMKFKVRWRRKRWYYTKVPSDFFNKPIIIEENRYQRYLYCSFVITLLLVANSKIIHVVAFLEQNFGG